MGYHSIKTYILLKQREKKRPTPGVTRDLEVSAWLSLYIPFFCFNSVKCVFSRVNFIRILFVFVRLFSVICGFSLRINDRHLNSCLFFTQLLRVSFSTCSDVAITAALAAIISSTDIKQVFFFFLFPSKIQSSWISHFHMERETKLLTLLMLLLLHSIRK